MKIKTPNWKWLVAIKLFFETRKLAKAKTQDKDTVEKWLEDPVNKTQVIEVAQTFNSIFRGGWFTISNVMSVTNYKTMPEALRILNILKLSNCLIAELRGGGSKEVYKITLNKDMRITFLKNQEKKLVKQLEEIRKELERS